MTENWEVRLHKVHSQPREWKPWPESCIEWQRVHANFYCPVLNRFHAPVTMDSCSKWSHVFLEGKLTTSFVWSRCRERVSAARGFCKYLPLTMVRNVVQQKWNVVSIALDVGIYAHLPLPTIVRTQQQRTWCDHCREPCYPSIPERWKNCWPSK